MKRMIACLLVALLPFTAVAEHHESVEAEVRALAEKFNTAYATNDADTYFGFYLPDSMLYFFGSRQDVATYDREWREAIAAGGGAAKNDMSELRIQVLSDTVAVASYFVDNETRTEDGVEASKAFETDVWHKVDGEWKIVSLHYSVL